MGKVHAKIGPDLSRWIAAQEMFFVATAPLGADGHINCSCAFAGPPQIVRLHGHGRVLLPEAQESDELRSRFPDYLGTRAIVCATIDRISDSCGYAVPRYAFEEQRDTLTRWSEKKGADGLAAYRQDKNARSIDGLPAMT